MTAPRDGMPHTMDRRLSGAVEFPLATARAGGDCRDGRYAQAMLLLTMACVQLACGFSARADDSPPPPIAAFAGRLLVEGVSVSPDGKRIARIQTEKGKGMVVVHERDAGSANDHLVLVEPDGFRLRWCKWATNTRVLCSFIGMASNNDSYYSATRLVGVDADGHNSKVLIQNSDMAQGQYQDRVLQWQPGPPDTVLVEADEGIGVDSSRMSASGFTAVYGSVGTHGAPAVFELNVVTGTMRIRQHARPPIRSWAVDSRGQARLGWGQEGAETSYYAHLLHEGEWRRLAKFEVFSKENNFEPIAISDEDPNKAYAIASSEGRDAVWLMDLTDKTDPTLVFAHPAVDASEPLLARDGHLLGVFYENEYPNVFFTDPKAKSLHEEIQRALPGVFSTVVDSSLDASVYVIRSFSDVKPPSYSVLDTGKHTLVVVGGPSKDLKAVNLAQMRPIHYAARDGVEIPGYLTTPRGVPAQNLPLIVMPHGGPIARDSWEYDFLVQFLASRGYAVLQMNFRGSSGYGSDWFYAAHQDWGGLTYDDMIDGARYAIQKGIADPGRICIVGWSFGGYIALLGAQRNSDLFRCSVDIAGVSDLQELIDDGYNFMNGHSIRALQLGGDKNKLRRDSPRLHAADFKVPLLIVHGDHDAQVPFRQSKIMAAALGKAGKPYRLVEVKNADHSLHAESDRVTLLTEVEGFLAAHLAAAGEAAH